MDFLGIFEVLKAATKTEHRNYMYEIICMAIRLIYIQVNAKKHLRNYALTKIYEGF